MAFNYSKLLGKIRECGYTQEEIAKQININHGTLSLKLNNKSAFTTREVNGICKILGIPNEEIGAYFFAE